MRTGRAAALLGLVLAMGVGTVGCEDKKPAPPSAPASAQKPAAAPMSAAPVKEAVESAKTAAGEMVEKAKEAVAKPVEEAKAKVAEVSAQARDAMKGYLDSLGQTNGILAKITNPLNAGSSLGDLGKAAQNLNGYTSVLNALPADQKTSLLGENKSALDPLLSAFKGHVERLGKDGALSKLTGDALKGFNLFE